MKPDLNKEHRLEGERWRKEVEERKKNNTKNTTFKPGIELQNMLQMAAKSRQQKYKPIQEDDIRRRIGEGEREAEIPPGFTTYNPPPYSSHMLTGIERLWQTISNIVKKLMSQHGLEWIEVFKMAVTLYNTSAHQNLRGMLPNMIHYNLT